VCATKHGTTLENVASDGATPSEVSTCTSQTTAALSRCGVGQNSTTSDSWPSLPPDERRLSLPAHCGSIRPEQQENRKRRVAFPYQEPQVPSFWSPLQSELESVNLCWVLARIATVLVTS
jgi:hypothetical protein